jgi:hypothetical protein
MAIATRKTTLRWAAHDRAKHLLQGLDEVEVPELTNQVLAELEQMPNFHALVMDEARAIIYSAVLAAVATTRKPAGAYGVRIREMPLAQRLEVRKAQISAWMERVGHHHVRLLEMTKQDLAIASQDRARVGEYHTRIAELWQLIMAGMDETQHVEDAYSIDDLARLYEETVGADPTTI